MPSPRHPDRIESHLDRWRDHLRQQASDADALEERLRGHTAALRDAGLSEDEAFLIAVKRIGGDDPASRAFAREHAERTVWKPLAQRGSTHRETVVAFGLALLAAIAVKLPELWGLRLEDANAGFYLRNFSLFVLPILAGYFAWKRRASPTMRIGLALAFVVAAVLANFHLSPPGEALQGLIALHLPIALWLAVGVAHAGGRWNDTTVRMDFVRFSGEAFIHYVLIALGGAVLMGFTFAMFASIDMNAEPFFERWLLPCGVLGAVVIAAWLVDSRQGVAGSIAPLLTRLFTPLFVFMLLVFLATMTWTGQGPLFDRNLLIAFDLLLAVVVGLLLYAIAGRDPAKPAGAFDYLQLVLVIAALLVDAAALWAMAGRVAEFGFTPNRAAALGENLILLLNLAGSAVLYIRFALGRGGIAALERWQMRFLPVYAAWAMIVVVVFPVLFARA